jgi:phenylpropionate dioxygenase-like ring-hydroxylating dioxygenase large terminal subunit
MLRKDQNELLSRVGAGTPMGELFRRFWLPAVSVQQVGEPDSAPVRLRILGEDLVAFRDTNGRVGIVRAYCSHRLAPLFFGRNEQCGIRCPYHGWKFDVAGNCLETPNVPRGAPDIRKNVGITAYPTHEAGGVVWVYMGPKEKCTPFRALEYAHVPEGQYFSASWLQRTNWSQGMEGEIDSSHISWLHKDFDSQGEQGRHPVLSGGASGTGTEYVVDGAPVLELRETPSGFTYGARRDLNGQYLWRVTQWVAPMFSLIPRAPGAFVLGGGRAWVPIDDNHTTVFTFGYRVDRPFTADEIQVYESGALFPPRMRKGVYRLPDGYVIDTHLPEATQENDYQINRQMQRSSNYSGIWGIHDQDRALAENSKSIGTPDAGIIDRSLEHLVSSDRPVVTARRTLMRMAEELQKGIEPACLAEASGFAVRAISKICKIQAFDDFLACYGEEAGYQRPALTK